MKKFINIDLDITNMGHLTEPVKKLLEESKELQVFEIVLKNSLLRDNKGKKIQALDDYLNSQNIVFHFEDHSVYPRYLIKSKPDKISKELVQMEGVCYIDLPEKPLFRASVSIRF